VGLRHVAGLNKYSKVNLQALFKKLASFYCENCFNSFLESLFLQKNDNCFVPPSGNSKRLNNLFFKIPFHWTF